MREDDVGRGFAVHVSPSVLVIRAGASHVVRGVDHERFEHAGGHQLAGEIGFVELHEQSGGPGRVRGGHARAAIGAVVGIRAGCDARVNTHAVGHDVRLDAAVIARPHARESSKRSLAYVANTTRHRIIGRADRHDVFREAVVCNGLITPE